MSIQSMTGFGKGEASGTNFDLSIEIKSVNHRFKDIRFKIPNMFSAMEIELKKEIEKKFSRGSFDIYLSYNKNQQKKEDVELDFEKIKSYIQKLKLIAEQEDVVLNVSPTEFLRSDFYLEDEAKEEELFELSRVAFKNALRNLTVSREQEGGKLVQKLLEHKESYEKYYHEVVGLKESYQDKVREKLSKRFENNASELNIDEPRFLQEVIYYLEKLDIDEETNRINIHLQKLAKVLSSTGEVGRQIDFLMQELNRETNTIGSKSGNSDISENVVQMKVQMEKIREQALNLQ